MVWATASEQTYKDKPCGDGSIGARVVFRRAVLPSVVVGSLICLVVLIYSRWTPTEVMHPIIKFEDKFTELCRKPKLPIPEYTSVESFFSFIKNPETDFCYSWIEFGGEKLPVSAQTEEECNDEVRKAKFICFNEEYKMNQDPCLIYSFGKDFDSQFERDMHLFSCEVHAFDSDQVTQGEHVQHTEFWYEHNWDIAEFPYDLPASEDSKGKARLRRSLDFITTVLGHKGREIKYLKSDLQGREWLLLKQILTHHDIVDIRQLGLRLHLPVKTKIMTPEERHDTYKKLFQVFQGLTCAGYRYVLSRPIKYYKGGIRVPEMNKTFFPAYEVNFVKDLNI